MGLMKEYVVLSQNRVCLCQGNPFQERRGNERDARRSGQSLFREQLSQKFREEKRRGAESSFEKSCGEKEDGAGGKKGPGRNQWSLETFQGFID